MSKTARARVRLTGLVLAAIVLTATGFWAIPTASAQGTGVVRGTITNSETGEPVAKVDVDLLIGPSGIPYLGYTDSNGDFEFTDVPLGPATIVAGNGWEWQTFRQDLTVSSSPTTIDIELVPEPTGSVSGTVTYSATNEPAPALALFVSHGSGFATLGETDANGRYSIDGLVLGPATISTPSGLASPWLANDVDFTVIEGDTVIDMELTSKSSETPTTTPPIPPMQPDPLTHRGPVGAPEDGVAGLAVTG